MIRTPSPPRWLSFSQVPQRGRQWDGMLDEARVLNIPKDEHWIKLDYESQRGGQKFYTFGDVVKR